MINFVKKITYRIMVVSFFTPVQRSRGRVELKCQIIRAKAALPPSTEHGARITTNNTPCSSQPMVKALSGGSPPASQSLNMRGISGQRQATTTMHNALSSTLDIVSVSVRFPAHPPSPLYPAPLLIITGMILQ